MPSFGLAAFLYCS